MKFTIYDPNGKIVRCGDCPEEIVQHQRQEGEFLLIAESHPNEHYVLNGVLVSLPPKPSAYHVFNYTTKQWEDPRTLDDRKAAQWTQIKQARSAAEYAGFTWDGSTFDSDATSQNRITRAVALAQMSDQFTIGWVLKDNTVRTLNSLGMMQVGAALGQHVATQFAKGVLLREQIEAATTPEDVAAVVW